MITPDPRRWRPFFVRLAFELVVVFIGVYAAFALSEARASREAAERREQVQRALIREVRDLTANTRGATSFFGDRLAAYDSAFAAGGTPELIPMIEAVRVESHMWEAALQSGGLDLMEVETIYRLSQFYNQLNMGFEQLAQLRTLSETVLIPNLGRGTDEFYAEPGRLRPKYSWYMEGLRNIHGHAARITQMGDEVVAELDDGGA